MIDALQSPIQMPPLKQKLPSVPTEGQEEKLAEVAHEFSSVFFSECIRTMLEEVEKENEDEDLGMEIAGALMAETIGEEMARSGTGQQLTNSLLSSIIKLQGGTTEMSNGFEQAEITD